MVVVLLVTVAACGKSHVDAGPKGGIPEGGDEQVRLDAAKALWAAAKIADYDFSYRQSCFCPQITVQAKVRGGKAVEHHITPVEMEGESLPLTMEAVYDVIAKEIRDSDSVQVDYDPDNGRVRSMNVDRSKNSIDDEYGYTVETFRLPGDPLPTVDPATLTKSWPCGFGLHASNVDETVAILLDVEGIDTPVTPMVTLPNGAWTGQVLIGRHLFANWCTDVIEPNPVQIIEERWKVVAGTITFADKAPALNGPISSVIAHVTGLAAERPDGSRVEIGDLDMSNTSWGALAG